MAHRKSFQVVDKGRNMVSPVMDVWVDDEDVRAFVGAVKDMFMDSLLKGIPEADLKVYAPIDLNDSMTGRGANEALILEVSQRQSATMECIPDAVWHGEHGSIGMEHVVKANNDRMLQRSDLVGHIIYKLKEKRLLLVESPPMTEKTSLAALIGHELVKRGKVKHKKVLVASFSTLATFGKGTFQDAFKKDCAIEWGHIKLVLHQGYKVYLVVDEIQAIYDDGSNGQHGTEFWQIVRLVRDTAETLMRILMFAGYGSDLQYTRHAAPLEIPSKLVFGIEDLNFSPREIQEYVSKWFKGFESLEDAKMEFCVHLTRLIGGHAGLCATAIDALNEVYKSRYKRRVKLLSSEEWIQTLKHGSLENNDQKLIEALISSRGVTILKTLENEELEGVQRLVYGVATADDDEHAEQCVRKGILVQNGDNFNFTSPAMLRFFMKMRFGHIERSFQAPKTLRDMIARIIGAIDYDTIRNAFGKSKKSGIPLERTWQMEFYKTAYLCTPSGFVSSTDVGALFNSRGLIDFTVHCGDIFWDIELLREASRLREHISRFAPGRKYSLLGLSDYCLIDFRCVDSIADVTRATYDAHLKLCDKLYIVCYDLNLENVAVFNFHVD